MTDTMKRRKRLRRMLRWSAYSLLLVLVLPLIPYAIDAADNQADAEFIKVPNPGSELWRDVRQRDRTVIGNTQIKGVDSDILINQGGEDWRLFRMEILVPYGAILMGLILVAIILFHLLRGTVRLEDGYSGKKILRFTLSERIVHWFTVAIFWLLGITGLILLYGRFVLIPLLGPDGFSITASASKEAHNLFGPLFLFAMIALFMAFVKKNFFLRRDLKWLSNVGGLFGGHASAGFFNAGEKIWFWLVVLLGFALCITGLILDFAVIGQSREVMTLSHVIHGISAMVIISVSFGHIYIGTAGTEGSFSSMANGHVDTNWAQTHHDLWYEKVKHTAVDAKALQSDTLTKDMVEARRDV